MCIRDSYGATFLDAAGVAAPEGVQGRSFLPVLRGETPDDWRDAIYYAYYESHATHNVAAHDGVRTGRHKLMRFPETGEWQLFDLEADPSELTSLHDAPEYASVLSDMRRRYAELRERYRVPEGLPTP